LRIPYKAIPLNESPAFPGLTVRWTPIIPVRIVDSRMQVRTKSVWAVVDTGSDNCLFHANLLAPFNIALESGIRADIGGIGKQTSISVYYHDIRLLIGVDWTLSIRAGFSREFSVAAILGRNGFFDSFRVTFDHTEEPPFMTVERIARKNLN
jgi:hypothetical protein